MNMKNYGQGLFLSPKNTEEGDILTFANEGIEGDYEGKPNITFDVELDGDVKKITLNPTSVQNMAEVHGWESSAWIGKTAEITFVEKPIQKELVKYIVLKPIMVPDSDKSKSKVKDEDIPTIGEKADPAKKSEDGVRVEGIPF